MTIPSFRSKGAYGVGTTSCVAAVPTGGSAPQVNDILLIVVESSDSTTLAGTPNTPANWTKIFEETQGAGATGVTTLTVFAKRAGASEADVTIDGVGNHCSATMLVYSGCLQSGTAWSVGTGNGAASGNGTILGLNTPEADCLVVVINDSSGDSNSTTTFSAWTNANLSNLTEREDNRTNTGAGGGFGVADGGKAVQGATGDTTVTISTSVPWRSVAIALRPQPASTPLTIQNADSAHTSDAFSLTQHNVLVIQAADSLHTEDTPSLVQHNVLVIQDSDSVHPVDALTLGVALIIANADSLHSSDVPSLIQHHILTISPSDSLHSSDTLSLVQHNILVIQAADSLNSSDIVTLIVGGGSTPLVIQDADSLHTAENLALMQHNVLVIQPADSIHVSDNLTIIYRPHYILVVQDADSLQASDVLELIQAHVLQIQDADSQHESERVRLGDEPEGHGHISILISKNRITRSRIRGHSL